MISDGTTRTARTGIGSTGRRSTRKGRPMVALFRTGRMMMTVFQTVATTTSMSWSIIVIRVPTAGRISAATVATPSLLLSKQLLWGVIMILLSRISTTLFWNRFWVAMVGMSTTRRLVVVSVVTVVVTVASAISVIMTKRGRSTSVVTRRRSVVATMLRDGIF